MLPTYRKMSFWNAACDVVCRKFYRTGACARIYAKHVRTCSTEFDKYITQRKYKTQTHNRSRTRNETQTHVRVSVPFFETRIGRRRIGIEYVQFRKLSVNRFLRAHPSFGSLRWPPSMSCSIGKRNRAFAEMLIWVVVVPKLLKPGRKILQLGSLGISEFGTRQRLQKIDSLSSGLSVPQGGNRTNARNRLATSQSSIRANVVKFAQKTRKHPDGYFGSDPAPFRIRNERKAPWVDVPKLVFVPECKLHATCMTNAPPSCMELFRNKYVFENERQPRIQTFSNAAISTPHQNSPILSRGGNSSSMPNCSPQFSRRRVLPTALTNTCKSATHV
ncbi:unnamed protein product [Nesidiocoris tenuis]|uniref:Uncharacterized protein n=1 Tax=Nesidiocoris tenuis TaxID=355587 RepID=A0A6H5H6D8_9HEMI|nr:unnamed protein product [Nesidiocoris tenuis]